MKGLGLRRSGSSLRLEFGFADLGRALHANRSSVHSRNALPKCARWFAWQNRFVPRGSGDASFETKIVEVTFGFGELIGFQERELARKDRFIDP